MSDARITLGKRGEELACRELERRGYAIVARRFRVRGGELDIVARDGPTLVFVEVKARQSLAVGEGFESVTPAKQRRIEQLAAAWLVRNPHDGAIRYDVLSLQWTGRRFRITHFPDAWMFDATLVRWT